MAGRKRILTPTPLGRFSDEKGIRCTRVENINTQDVLDFLARFHADILVVVSFGQILKESVLNLFPLGCFNVHASILPKYRGASPIVSCLLNGEKETGVTFMKMERGLDSGPIYEIHKTEISPYDTASSLERKLSQIAAERIEDCLLHVSKGELHPYLQPEEGVSMVTKIAKSDGFVCWEENAETIERKIRAYENWPSVTTRFATKSGKIIRLKITKASCFDSQKENEHPGAVTEIASDHVTVSCGKGFLRIYKVIPEGKKEMPVSDFRNGTLVVAGQTDFLNGQLP